MSEDGTKRTWDEENCPNDDCGGDLQQQDRFNVMCLECEDVWTHYVETDGTDVLANEDREVVA